MANTDDKKDKKQAAKARAKKYGSQKDVNKAEDFDYGTGKKESEEGRSVIRKNEVNHLIKDKGLSKKEVYGDLQNRKDAGEELGKAAQNKLDRYNTRQEKRTERKTARKDARAEAKERAQNAQREAAAQEEQTQRQGGYGNTNVEGDGNQVGNENVNFKGNDNIVGDGNTDNSNNKGVIGSGTQNNDSGNVDGTGNMGGIGNTNTDNSIDVDGDVAQEIGKRGDMNTTIGDKNEIIGSSIGNDYSVTIGNQSFGTGSGGSNNSSGNNPLANMQTAASYTALNNNQHAQSSSQVNGLGTAMAAIAAGEKATGASERVGALYNLTGMDQQYWSDKATAKQGDYLGDIFDMRAPDWTMPDKPKKPEDKTEEIAEDFNDD